MKDRQLWVDHKFGLGFDIGWSQNILCRIQDSPIRIQHHCTKINDEKLSERHNNSWSIKEHIGHLIDLEELWSNRFLEYPLSHVELNAADMSNRKTEKSNHNSKNLIKLLDEFKTERSKLIAVFEGLDEKSQNHIAMHPRIKLPMRPVDLLFFVAEHDDHHITSIKEIIGKLDA